MENNLPKITKGSVKQIAWAEKIRKTWIKKLTNWIGIDPQNPCCDSWKILLNQYQTRDDAEWFIDWRTGAYTGGRGTRNYL